MENKNNSGMITTSPRQDDRSRVVLSRSDMSTPYMSAFFAAKENKRNQITQMPPQAYSPSQYPTKNVVRRPEVYDELESGNDISKAKTKVKPIKAKREAIIIILVILIAAMIAVSILSALKIMPEYSEFYRKNDITTEKIEEESTESTSTPITNLDIALGFLKKFLPDKLTQESIFFDDYMSTVDDMEMLPKIMTYVVPVTIMVTAVIVLIFFIRLLVAMFTPKRRKLYVLSTIIILLLCLINVVAMFIAVAGTEFAKITDFITFLQSATPLQIQLGIGSIAMAGLALLAFIFSFFAFKSKKKVA